MRAEIISCGTELLLGHITDTNATYLAQSLAALGIDLYFVSQVGDNQGRIVETLRRAWERSDLIVMTGGLGPTEDDLARESISTLLGETMQVDPQLEAELRSMFAARNSQMPERNVKQATRNVSHVGRRSYSPPQSLYGWPDLHAYFARLGPGRIRRRGTSATFTPQHQSHDCDLRQVRCRRCAYHG